MTKAKFLPVLEDKNLLRDTESKALLSTNKSALMEHRQKKQFLINIMKQSEEIEILKKDINEIKDLLLKIVKEQA